MANGIPPAAVPRRADAPRARHRLRRHRHQPALRGQGNVRAGPRHRADHRQHPRRPLDDLLGADDRRLAQVRDAHHARRQPRRGRHHGAARARFDVDQGPPGMAHAAARWSGVFGASLFYGDAVLTPAISVLSAVEGLEVGTRAFKPYVLPISVGVLIALFAVPAPRHGGGGRAVRAGHAAVVPGARRRRRLRHRAKPGRAAGAESAARDRASCRATASPRSSCWARWCSPSPARRRSTPTWAISARARCASPGSALVMPALVLNYFGQGALLIANPAAVQNPFYLLVPGWALYPMVALATAATVIASQATISGAYSITKQAIQLGFLPRMNIVHTSARTIGQIYIPAINWILLAAVLAAVIGFGSSSQARLGLRRGGHGDHAGGHVAHLLRDPLRLGLPARAVHRRDRVLPRGGRGVLLRDAAQGRRRRLVPARDRRRGVHRDDDVAARARDPVRAAARVHRPARVRSWNRCSATRRSACRARRCS